MHPVKEAIQAETRRQFFGKVAMGVGGLALSSLMAEDAFAAPQDAASFGGLPSLPHFAPKAKRCIYLHMMGAPPQMDLLDYKPKMRDWYDKDLPESIRQGQRLTTMTSGQARFPIAPSVFKFDQHGQSGAWISEILPYTARMADDIAIVRSMHTDAINHEPGITFIQTGQQIPGRPCIGAWFAYGLGSMNEDLPTFVVMNAEKSHPKSGVQAISAKLWSAGFLSPEYAGVRMRTGADPVLYLRDPDGVSRDVRRQMLDGLADLNRIQHEQLGSPETLARIQQYEMAFRMQSSGAGDGRPVERARAHVRALGRGGEAARQVPERGPDGAAAGRAGRALRPDLPPRLGTSTRSRPRCCRRRPATSIGPPGPLFRTLRSAGSSTRPW